MTAISRTRERAPGATSLRALSTLLSAALVAAGLAVAAAPANAGPPLGRAYELVSPADDPSGSPAGVAINSVAMPGYAAQDGDAVVYGAPGPIGTAINGAPNPLIFGVRDPVKGWSAEVAPRTADGGDTGLNVSAGQAVATTVSPDAASVVFGTGDRLTPEANESSVYRIDRGIAMPLWIPATDTRPVTSPDLTTVAFNQIVGGVSNVYVLRNGVVELASVLPGGATPIGTPFVANNRGSIAASALPALRFQNTLTPDGRYLIFGENLGGGADQNGDASLYVRDLEAGVTRALAVRPNGASPLERDYGPSPSLSPAHASGIHPGYVSVAAEAPTAFFRGSRFTTTPKINRFYEANLETGEVTYRPAITGPPVRVSDDGRRLMFVHMPDRMTADPFEIRLWDRLAPESSTLLGIVPRAENSGGSGLIVRFVRSVNGGDTWVFGASGSLDPARPNLNSGATQLQLYRWNIGDPHPTCLSCEPTDGVARFPGINMGVSETSYSESLREPNGWTNSENAYYSATPSRSASADGRIIAFDSPDRLTAEDQNDIRDVYLWDADAPAGQQLQLVTSGDGELPSFFLDMGEDGQNLFFTTTEGLVAADQDLSYDVYVARVGGGFPGSPASCVGEGCRPAVIATPSMAMVGSATAGGDGNLRPAPAMRPARVGVRLLKSARGPAARLQVRAPGAGRISVVGHAIRRANRSASKAGAYRLRVTLKPKARSVLNKRKRLTVRARVVFRAKSGRSAAKTVRISFRQSKQSSARKGR